MPRASQPSSMADPIFPAPSRTRRPESPRSGLSAGVALLHGARSSALSLLSPFAPLCLPGCFEHRGIERFTRGLASPNHELEGRELAVAGLERRAEQRLALLARGFGTAREDEGMAKHHDALGHPVVKMTDPEALIDERDQRLHLCASPFQPPQVKGTCEMQRFDIAHPSIRELIVGPAPGDQDCDLVVAGAFK